MKMTLPKLGMLICSALTLAFQPSAFADSFALAAGGAVEGDLSKLVGEEVTIRSGTEKVVHSISEFDGSAQDAIRSWADVNPHKVNVFTKWDAQPVIKSSSLPSLPSSLSQPGFKGMVSVDLVLDEKGKVIFAKVNKTTHKELEDVSLAAAKTWRFAPAKVGGKAVKAKLRVPFKFKGS